MNNITDAQDKWCEERFWLSVGVDTHGWANPFCALTGLLMSVMAVVPSTYETKPLPPLFLLCKATLFYVGLGTAFYHSVTFADAASWYLNLNMFDWQPIICMCSTILVLYLSHDAISEPVGMGAFLAIQLWGCFLVVGDDTSTYSHWASALSATSGQDQYGSIQVVVLMLPLCVVLLAYSLTTLREASIPVWIGIVVSGGMWLLDSYLCERYLWMMFFHAMYHVGMAYVFLYASCLGVTLGDEWQVQNVWPTLVLRQKQA